ncbi:methyl-accepting chemotaxis protein [Pseudohoeflea suaedae]|uniref:Methyl-accepting chemotaxis protein n=1 Tax=Pseudohoeflea suaedae TaxID=877384 RepID=A0A4R5PMQ7_9HYPH|nr:HAMP domain-containing methyl-accepting chemotaxis protein [Pseudohoeflea suaedae]TDH38300.1 methyl-accepting chemotaxis protein [Pseudohoeflea suaedae]
MSIDRLLARFSIQTKVLIFVVPLIGGIASLAAINFYTGSLLGQRLNGTGASIESLSGFQEAYSGMNEFLEHTTEDKRNEVTRQLDAQIESLAGKQQLASSDVERDALTNASEVAGDLRTNVDALWALHGQEMGIRREFGEINTLLEEMAARATSRGAEILEEITGAEEEAKELLRQADFLDASAREVVEIATAIATPSEPAEVFAAAEELSRNMRRMKTKLPRAIPDGQPGLDSIISDNLKGILDLLKADVVNPASVNRIQRFANNLRPVGIRLQGLASKLSSEAAKRFIEIDPQVVQGRLLINGITEFANRAVNLELLIAEFLGFPDETRAENMAVGLVRVDQVIQQMELEEGGPAIIELIGAEQLERVRMVNQNAGSLMDTIATRENAFDLASQRIEEGWQSILVFADSQRSAAADTKQRADGITFGGAAIAGLIAVLAATLLVAALKRPIMRLVDGMRNVAQGDLGTEVSDTDRRDEIGEMARALGIFRTNAIDKVRVERESEGARERAAAERARMDEEKAVAEASVQAAVAALGAALNNLAHGDLVSRIETPFEGNLDVLRVDFNESVDRMREAMSRIRDNAEMIQSNGGQMQAAADDLARRTEQQAASLEEVAAAVEQISSTVQSSSEAAAQTNSLAMETCSDVVRSSEVVAEAVDAMGRIDAASGKIGHIIEVIDQIAFQTNLLALNAGVEAARAGEAGRGFAVVAQEVRELAGRSATAAKQIKALIEHSAVEVHNGVSLVNQSGEAMSRVNERINEITRHIEALARASSEQATGLAEVNSSVSQMDQMTQQNAAMVEEVNASSQSLAHESVALTELVKQFRTSVESKDEARHPAAA